MTEDADGRLLVVALAAGTAAPVLAQRGPPLERDRQEEEADGARGEVRRVGRDRGESKEEAASRERQPAVEGQAPPAQGRGFERGRERPVQDAGQNERGPQQGNARRDAMREPVQNAPVDDSREQRAVSSRPSRRGEVDASATVTIARQVTGSRLSAASLRDGNDPRQAPPLRDQPYQPRVGQGGGYVATTTPRRSTAIATRARGSRELIAAACRERDVREIRTTPVGRPDRALRAAVSMKVDSAKCTPAPHGRVRIQQRMESPSREQGAGDASLRLHRDPYFYTPAVRYRVWRSTRGQRYAADRCSRDQFGRRSCECGEAAVTTARGGYQDNTPTSTPTTVTR